MDTYFEKIPLEINIIILTKSQPKDVGNLIRSLSLIYDPNLIGKELSIKLFDIKPKFNYDWAKVFETYFQVMQRGFNKDIIKSPIIDAIYDSRLIQYTKSGYRLGKHINHGPYQLSLANSYGVVPSELLRFLYKEGIYVPTLDLQFQLLPPLMYMEDHVSVAEIIDWYIHIGVGKNMPDRWIQIIEKTISLILSSKISVDIKVDLIKKIRLIDTESYNVSIIEYILELRNLNDDNISIVGALLDLYPDAILDINILTRNTQIFLEISNTFNVTIPFDNISMLSEYGNVVIILEYILSGKYENELSNVDVRNALLQELRDNLKVTEYSLDDFKKISLLMHKLVTY